MKARACRLGRLPAGFSAAVLALALAGCAVGPDYEGPAAPAPLAAKAASFRRAPLAAAENAPPPARWWESLRDPLLTSLVDAALQRSPNVALAQARLAAARASVNGRSADLLPKAAVVGAAGRTRIPLGTNAQLPPAIQTSIFDAAFDASWEIDLFGGRRRALESARAQVQSQEAQLADAQVQLAAEVAQAYVRLRDMQNRIALLQRSARLEEQIVALTRERQSHAVASEADVQRVASQWQMSLAQLPPLEAQADQALDALAVLTAQEPGELDDALRPAAALPLPPETVAVGDPARMLRRRPDIRVAERQLAASNAQIGQAIARYFPSVNLMGVIGFSSLTRSQLLDRNSLTYFTAPVLQWNFLDFGRVRAQVNAAEADRVAAIARYRGAVLSALQDAESALSRFGHERERVGRLSLADASSARALELTQQRNRAGTASLIDVLDVERQHVRNEQDLAQARAALTSDFVALQKALGLGWEAPAADPAPSHS
jgi:NodT family efflux transporter outer membrane factor (OMF) lipoprotein